MKVVSKVQPNWIPVKRAYRDGRPAKFRAFPSGSNKIDDEAAFETEIELAAFLLKNPEWKTYFSHPSGAPRNQHLAEVVS